MHTLQTTFNNPRQEHRRFRLKKVVATLPHRSINTRQYWKTLARMWEALTASHDAEAWRDWVRQNQQHACLHRIIVRQEESANFRFRAAVFLFVLRVADFNLYERPSCQEYTNFLRNNFVRGWFPKVKSFPKKEQAFLCKLLLLGAHTRSANEQDLMAYAWCAAEAISWPLLPVLLRQKLATFLESMSPFIKQEDSMLFVRIRQALQAHNAR